MRLFIYLFVLIFCMGVEVSYAQNSSKLDSLTQLLNDTNEDSVKARLLIEMANQEIRMSPENAIKYSYQAYSIASKLSDNLKLHARSEVAMAVCLLNSHQADSCRGYLLSAIDKYEILKMPKKQADAILYLGYAYQELNQPDSVVKYFNLALQMSNDHDYPELAGDAHFAFGNVLNNMGKNREALYNIEASYDYFKTNGDPEDIWAILNTLGIIHDDMGMSSEAVGYYLEALSIVEEIDDLDGKIILANNLGIIYNELGNNDKALEYYNKALEYASISNDKDNEATLLNNISFIQMEQGDTIRAIQSLQESIAICKEEGMECFLPYATGGLGDVYTDVGQYDSAKYYLDWALKGAQKCQLAAVLTSTYRDRGKLFMAEGNYRQSEKELIKALELAEASEFLKEKVKTLERLYMLKKEQRQPEKALMYHEQYISLKDSIFNVENQEQVTRMTAEFEFKKEKQKMEFEQAANEMRLQEKIDRQEDNRNGILIVLALTILLVVTLARSYYLIQKQNKKLTDLNEEKNTLMGVVAHDLRSPLNNIKSLLHLLKEGSQISKNDHQWQVYDMLDDTTDRMRDMIDKVLDINAIETMKVNLNIERVDLGETLKKASEQFKQVASQKTIEIHTAISEKQHFANVDNNYLTQIIDNLLSNAIKFSESGKQIDLDIEAVNGHQTISVKDQGPGISDADKNDLFKKFTTLSAKPTNNEASTGLGLSIVKKFVDAMEGEIWCESEIDKGTTFFVKFKSA